MKLEYETLKANLKYVIKTQRFRIVGFVASVINTNTLCTFYLWRPHRQHEVGKITFRK